MHKANDYTLKETFQSALQTWTTKGYGIFSADAQGGKGVCQPYNSVCLVGRVPGRGNSSYKCTESGVLCRKQVTLDTQQKLMESYQSLLNLAVVICTSAL